VFGFRRPEILILWHIERIDFCVHLKHIFPLDTIITQYWRRELIFAHFTNVL
jgi:hypothetical protein